MGHVCLLLLALTSSVKTDHNKCEIYHINRIAGITKYLLVKLDTTGSLFWHLLSLFLYMVLENHTNQH